MLELTLVRHATTELNEQRRYQGRSDPPLSEQGRREALRLTERLRGRDFGQVLCSDLRRCIETAALALTDTPARPDARLREMDFGAWDGLTYDECHDRHPERLARWVADPTRHSPPEGEAWDAFRRRVDQAVDALPRGGSTLLITHGGPIRRIVACALGLEWDQVVRMELSPCGVTRLALHPEGGHLRVWNDTAHLEPGGP